MTNDMKKRKELGDFLKTRRMNLSPEEYHIDVTSHRRAKGLRREEVADLAGVSNVYYTWLEQGRDVHPSEQVLENLGKALSLNRHELIYLYTLAGKRPPENNNSHILVDQTLKKVLEKLEPFPALVIGPRWDALAWNKTACELLGDFNEMDELERNSLWRMFVNPDYTNSLPEWEQVAKGLLAQFRNSYGRYIGDPWFEDFIRLLKATSKTFRDWWDHHDVMNTPPVIKRIRHLTKGDLVFKPQLLTVTDQPDLMITVYLPCDMN